MHDTPELRLLLEQHRLLPQPSRAHAAAGSLLAHGLMALLVVVVPVPPPPRFTAATEVTYRSTPLVAPRFTERTPKTGDASNEVNLEGLLARRQSIPTPPAPPSPTLPAAPQVFDAPPSPAPAPKPAIERPQIEKVPELTARNLPEPEATLGPGFDPPKPVAAPPQIEPVEKPKVTFESPSAQIGKPSGTGGRLLEAPKPASVEEAARAMTRGGGTGLTVGDVGAPNSGGLGEALSGTPGLRNASSLELLSDPMGADFRPYLIQILSTVRRNWLNVLPQSARFGRRGRVQIQFAIDRNGSVPKLVIALPSGTEALDRAAVAGISASNPFPPLPPEFKGAQVRLQFTFLYNISK